MAGSLELHELRVFLVAAETENFSETGRLLQISQPAVSGYIQGLEQKLHIRLFERTGRNIKLNEVGEAFVPVVRNLLKEARQAENFIAAHQGTVIGQVSVGCSTAAGKYILPQIVARFLECHSGVRITIQSGARNQTLERLSSGELDLAVSSLRIPRRDLEYRHFSDDQLVLIVPLGHPWAGRDSIQPQELLEHEIILRETGSGAASTLNRELARYDMSLDMLQSRLAVWTTEAIVLAVKAKIGPGFVSYTAAECAIRNGEAVEVPIEGFRLVQPLYLARHVGFHATEAQKALWDFTFAPQNEDLRQSFT